jgi:hypothetical protein
MAKIIKLTEQDLNRLVNKVLKEQEEANYMFFSNLNPAYFNSLMAWVSLIL